MVGQVVQSPGGSQLDRQRQAIQATRDLRDRGQLLVVEQPLGFFTVSMAECQLRGQVQRYNNRLQVVITRAVAVPEDEVADRTAVLEALVERVVLWVRTELRRILGQLSPMATLSLLGACA